MLSYIRNLVVQWSGSMHDSCIFKSSWIGARFVNGEINGILLGDSGYPLWQYLITPVLQAKEEKMWDEIVVSK